MGKTSSMWGKTTGKVGGLVYATSGGEQIVREYNPNVANPNTTAQVDQRAKMKLMSQMAATLEPVISMQKNGLVSKRNKFTKANFKFTYASGGVAQVSYENLQLTEGQLGLPMINGYIGDSCINLYLEENPSINIKRVVWCLFKKTEEGKLQFIQSQIVTEREEHTGKFFEWGKAEYIGLGVASDYVIYAYGMVDTSAQASARYGNLNVSDATDIANLVANRNINYTDFQFTQTRGATWKRGANSPTYTGTEEIQPNQVRIYVTATNGGTVSGAGVYDIGAEVTLQATAASGFHFVKWQFNGGGDYSTKNPVKFNATEQMDLVAIFDAGGNDSL